MYGVEYQSHHGPLSAVYNHKVSCAVYYELEKLEKAKRDASGSNKTNASRRVAVSVIRAKPAVNSLVLCLPVKDLTITLPTHNLELLTWLRAMILEYICPMCHGNYKAVQ